MDFVLTPLEVRVLGALVEKELTTPEYCPLSLNAVVLACNQRSNRDPVMSLYEEDVTHALETLRGRQLAWLRSTPGSRVDKFEHNLTARFGFSQMELSSLCALMLRGACTPGEIRGCTGRMYQFKDLAEVETILLGLATKENGPFVTKLPVQSGKKEHRYVHLFAGDRPMAEIDRSRENENAAGEPSSGPIHDRVAQLEERVAQLTEELIWVKKSFEEFRKAFE